MKHLIRLFSLAVISLFLLSCSDDSDSSGASSNQTVNTYKVVVIMSESKKAHWQQTASWALENIKQAQSELAHRVELTLEFKSQDDSDIEAYMKSIVNDDEVVAIVGPTTSAKAELLASLLLDSPKPMITPCATDAEYQRKYANAKNVWNMAESDIAELEILLSNIASHNEEKVTLLAYDPDSREDSRDTYVEWFAFIAEEFGIKDIKVMLYKDEADIRAYARQLCSTDYRKAEGALIFNPSNMSMALALDDEIQLIRKELADGKTKYMYYPRILCSDAFASYDIASKVQANIYEGIDIHANPSSGFAIAYQVKFGKPMMNGEAQFYDALLLLSYALTRQEYTQSADLCQCIADIVDGRSANISGWLPADCKGNFMKIAYGSLPNVNGCSGEWDFDETSHACQLNTTYRHWRLQNGTYSVLGYYTTEGSKRSTSSKEMWNWKATHFQKFDEFANPIDYPALENRWAVVIAASKGWSNYRFQADALAMYQMLRNHGYDDDHILLIAENDIAYHPKNPEQGVVKVDSNGVNLYQPSAIDYVLSDLYIGDLKNIMTGQKTDKLTRVISPTANDNVFVFWSGHGSNFGSLDFGSNGVYYWELKDIFKNVPHRKMMIAVEACFSGGLGQACMGMPGTIFITAANPNETSHAANWDKKTGVFLSNGFTSGFREAINKNNNVSLRDLYYTISRNTDGSHVKIYNESNYGSVFSNTMGDYFSTYQPR